MSVLQFNRAAVEPHAIPENPRNAAATYNIFQVAGQLGQADRGIAWLCRYLDVLVSQAGFPAPYPLVRGRRLIEFVRPGSKWSRDAVDAWLWDRLPPDAAARADAVTRAAASNAMAEAAARLTGEAA